MIRFPLALLLASALLPATASAQDAELPYWASIDAETANMRRGPGEQFPIDWVYHREGLPVKVVRLMQGWRYVEEPDGTQGWISSGLLSRRRTAIVTGEGLAEMRGDPGADGELRWNVEPGVVGALGDCEEGWCEFSVEGHDGWIAQERLWGDGDP